MDHRCATEVGGDDERVERLIQQLVRDLYGAAMPVGLRCSLIEEATKEKAISGVIRNWDQETVEQLETRRRALAGAHDLLGEIRVRCDSAILERRTSVQAQ
jgi:hypothetical protein